jgi:hypothetical protein
LGYVARRRRNAYQIELAEQLVVGRRLALAFEHSERHRGLTILGLGRGEHLALLGRDRRVAINQAGEYATMRFNAERQRRNVEQKDVLDVALQYAGLDRSAHSNHFVRINAFVRLLAEQLLHDLLDLRHAGHAADQEGKPDLVVAFPDRRGTAGMIALASKAGVEVTEVKSA